MQASASVGPFGVPGNSGSLHAMIPTGVIVMWSGLLSQIPVGWALCDGTLGTPNLTARFVRGINSSTTNPGSTGGSDSLTVTQNAHDHELPFQFQSGIVNRTASIGTGSTVASAADWGTSTETNSRARQKSAQTTATNQAHDNRPAYYELAFIMKL